MRLDQGDLASPGDHAVHLAQELLAPGAVLLECVLQAGKAGQLVCFMAASSPVNGSEAIELRLNKSAIPLA